ncbi:MAG: hypothetical protein JO108_15025 [Acidobacteriaceae bacterium]|nr:hypothetical protein [Acidobacteriaceae bacterium]
MLGRRLLQQGRSPDGRLGYESSPDGIVVHEKDAPDVLLEWAFGAGVQGSTAVGQLGNQFIEHRFSYYSRIQDLAPTFGHPPRVITPIAELGVLQDSKTITRCFSCHGTGAQQTPSGPDLTGLLPGVQCERCHGPGSSHIQAVRDGAQLAIIRREIANPGRLPALAQIQFCGQCHRLPGPDTGDAPELENPVTIRFAPVGLLASRCFREGKTLSCLNCHNPHEDLKPRTDLSYTRTCVRCHAADTQSVKLCRRKQGGICVTCHMPQGSVSPYLTFTDHRIRVVDSKSSAKGRNGAF